MRAVKRTRAHREDAYVKVKRVLSPSSETVLICPGHRGLERHAQRSLFGLERDGVHVWLASLDLPTAAVFDLERSLSDDEKEKAGRFRFARDRGRFVVGRGLLRWLVGAYVDCESSAVRFAYGPFGKPRLAPRSDPESLSFNLSHSGALAVFAFGRDRKLGVDVELLDCKTDVHEVSNQFFTSQEVADIMARPPHEQHVRFLEFWTRKEALVKALGRGLSTALREFDVSTIGDAPDHARPLWLAHPTTSWSVRQFVPAPGYIAALAASGGAFRVVYRELRWTQSQSRGLLPV